MFCNSDSGILSHIDINTNFFMENMKGLQANPGLPISRKTSKGNLCSELSEAIGAVHILRNAGWEGGLQSLLQYYSFESKIMMLVNRFSTT